MVSLEFRSNKTVKSAIRLALQSITLLPLNEYWGVCLLSYQAIHYVPSYDQLYISTSSGGLCPSICRIELISPKWHQV
jgi:hypothetical protein